MSKKDVLQFLTENQTEYVSGEALCRRLGITRAAVWKAVAALRKEGYEIEARPSLGYRLTAAPDALDPTLQSAQRIALANGYDSFLMFNVYAQRATHPDDMEHTCNTALHAENRKAFRYLLSLSERPAVWAAWGNIIMKRNYLMDCMRDFLEDGRAVGAKWFTAGPLLKSGHPHHPLYLRRDTKLLDFDIEAYLKK